MRCQFVKNGPIVEADAPIPRPLVCGSRVLGQIDAHDADDACGPHNLDEIVEHELRMLIPRRVVSLIPDGLVPFSVPADSAASRIDSTGSACEIDWHRADFAGETEPVLLLVDDEDLTRPSTHLDRRRRRSYQRRPPKRRRGGPSKPPTVARVTPSVDTTTPRRVDLTSRADFEPHL